MKNFYPNYKIVFLNLNIDFIKLFHIYINLFLY